MLESLKTEVFEANLALVKYGLVIHTWGNASGIDREKGLIVIKPSGVSYDAMKPGDMVVADMDGKTVEGKLNPSSDLPTHLELYKAFAEAGGITHTHSTFATAWAQSGRAVPFYGTTHADYFYGDIPCARALTREETESEYEKNTGKVIAEAFANIKPLEMPGVLVKSHGVFTWGKNAREAADFAKTLEEVAKMAYLTESLNGKAERAPQYLLDKHYLRKHGKNAYYGQKNYAKKED